MIDARKRIKKRSWVGNCLLFIVSVMSQRARVNVIVHNISFQIEAGQCDFLLLNRVNLTFTRQKSVLFYVDLSISSFGVGSQHPVGDWATKCRYTTV